MTTVLHVDPRGRPGGGQLGLARVLRADSALRHEALFLSGGPVLDRLVADGLPARRSALDSEALPDLVRHARVLRTEIEGHRPDVVVANGLRAAVAVGLARPRGATLLGYLRMDMTRSTAGSVEREIAGRGVLPRFDGILVNSRWTATTLHPRLRSMPVEVVYPLSGLDALLHLPRVAPSSPLRLLFLGTVTPWKGPHLAVAALRRLVESGSDGRFRLTVAGEPGPGDEHYAARLQQGASGLPVSFVGHVWDTTSLLAQHDVLLHTTVRPEPFGQVVAQAAAAGMVVVTTDHGGQVEITGRDGAAFYRGGDVESLSAVVRDLADDRQRMAAVGTAARRRAAELSDARAIQMLDAAVERLAVSRAGARP